MYVSQLGLGIGHFMIINKSLRDVTKSEPFTPGCDRLMLLSIADDRTSFCKMLRKVTN